MVVFWCSWKQAFTRLKREILETESWNKTKYEHALHNRFSWKWIIWKVFIDNQLQGINNNICVELSLKALLLSFFDQKCTRIQMKLTFYNYDYGNLSYLITNQQIEYISICENDTLLIIKILAKLNMAENGNRTLKILEYLINK